MRKLKNLENKKDKIGMEEKRKMKRWSRTKKNMAKEKTGNRYIQKRAERFETAQESV